VLSAYNEPASNDRSDVSEDFPSEAGVCSCTVTTGTDRALIAADTALKALSGSARAGRACPTADSAELSPAERRLSGALMRVNHVGEVCAQALYQAQALTARTPELRAQMTAAAREETDHLAWTERRLRELGDRPSLLNPLWYAGAFAIGLAAGRAGDARSLGFVVETERQVEEHLASHLARLPEHDSASRAIVAQMKDDEAQHDRAAEQAGAATLPLPLRLAMRLAAKVMTTTAHRI
jgi:ubiquinone biosynthesis monooxygenase Coq7